jgi:phosphoribosylaminoimidazolecarboxamide formyltransferase/IMP cyclohydrolase
MDRKNIKRMYRTAKLEKLPETIHLVLEKVQSLRYGTNPHQTAALYKLRGSRGEDLVMGGLRELKTGKEGLSQTNIEDMDRALRITAYFQRAACAVMKHKNPSGVAVARKEGEGLITVYRRARDCDSRAAFGSVVGFNTSVDRETAEELVKTFVEVVVAPGYGDEALQIFEGRKDLRVVEVHNLERLSPFSGEGMDYYDISVLGDGSIIVSEPYKTGIRRIRDLSIVTEKKPSEGEFQDLLFSWYVCANTRSNAIVLAKDYCTVSVGAGQQDRVTAVKIAIDKAIDLGHRDDLEGSVLASDGFFPFRDSIDLAAKYGISSIIQPGGSVRDEEIIDACNKHGISMVFTGERCFAHF